MAELDLEELDLGSSEPPPDPCPDLPDLLPKFDLLFLEPWPPVPVVKGDLRG